MKFKRRRKRATPAMSTVQDWRATEPALHAEVAPVQVDDPAATGHGKKITVLRQQRNDPLARLHTRRQIDEAQYDAGRAYQRDWETALRGIRALDFTRERVDGGAPREPVSERQIRARKRLLALEQALGRTMHRVTYAVLVDGMNMETLAQRLFNREGEASAKYYGRMLRDSLDVLAVEYGLAGPVAPGKPTASSLAARPAVSGA